MSRLAAPTARLSRKPVWEIAELFPDQGTWSKDEYLDLQTPRQIEFEDGRLEILPMPTEQHQSIVLFLFLALERFISPKKLGKALVAAMPVLIAAGKFREPDVMFMLARNAKRRSNRFWDGADLVMEVVSGGAKDRQRDFRDKRRDYARAGISEYWIVDPKSRVITVLKLRDGSYVEHGVFSESDRATSAMLIGFGVDVSAVFAA